MIDDAHEDTDESAPARKPRAGRGARKAKAAVAVDADSVELAQDAAAPLSKIAPYKTRDLVERVSKVAGMKRRTAKPLVETVLAELGTVLGEGRSMSLGPLGKITVARTREAGGGQVLVCRIRQRGRKGDQTGVAGVDEALAEAGEGS